VEAGAAFEMDRKMAYALLRATTGLNISLHGFTRIFIGGMPAFFNYMLGQFKDTALPVWQVHAFASVLPYVELVMGALLLVGLWTRWMSALGALIMMALVFGTSFRSDWNLVFLQMFYSFLYFLLLFYRKYDAWSVDALLRKDR
jgi:thiosulfate dehydrogenase [quinone] large subunit